MSAPNCKCHDQPMLWHKDQRRKAGGYFRCLVRKREQCRETARRWREQNPELKRERNAKRVFIGSIYAGMEHHFPGGRESLGPLYEALYDFKARQAAELTAAQRAFSEQLERKRDETLQKRRDKYDSDPIFRIEGNLKNAARKRRMTIERRKAQLAEEEAEFTLLPPGYLPPRATTAQH
jgi:hypothetical protein